MKIKKNDEVLVTTGKDKGRKGKVIQAFPEENTVIIQGVHIVKKSVKKGGDHPNGGFVEKEQAIHASNVQLIDPKSGKPTRTKVVTDAQGNKKRVAVKSGHVFE